MAEHPKHCIFCDGRPLSKEDIWPTWMTPYFPRDIERYEYGRIDVYDDDNPMVTRINRGGDPRSRRAKCVCRKCNSGWMSVLQSKAKGVVLSLAQGEARVLTEEDQRVLARWIAMVTITSEFIEPRSVAIPESDRDWVMNRVGAPENWKIWIGDYVREEWRGWRSHNALPVHEDDEADRADPLKPRPPNTQTTTLVFGRLYVHALSSSIARLVGASKIAARAKLMLKQVWPFENEVVWPPERTMSNGDAHRVSSEIFGRLTGRDFNF